MTRPRSHTMRRNADSFEATVVRVMRRLVSKLAAKAVAGVSEDRIDPILSQIKALAVTIGGDDMAREVNTRAYYDAERAKLVANQATSDERFPDERPGDRKAWVSQSDIAFEAAYTFGRDRRASDDNLEIRVIRQRYRESAKETLRKWGMMPEDGRLPDDVDEAINRIASSWGQWITNHAKGFALAPGAYVVGPSAAARTSQRKRDRADALYRKAHEGVENAKTRYAKVLNRYSPRALAVVRTGDPDAVEKLREKLEKREARQAMMKAANRIVRKKGLSDEERVEQLAAMDGIGKSAARALLKPDFAGRTGFPPYRLKNNNAEIRRIKARIEEMQRVEARNFQPVPFEWDGIEGAVIDNEEAARVQIVFDGKPPKTIRDALKARGFNWSPTEGAWQRRRTDRAVIDALQLVGVEDAWKVLRDAQGTSESAGGEAVDLTAAEAEEQALQQLYEAESPASSGTAEQTPAWWPELPKDDPSSYPKLLLRASRATWSDIVPGRRIHTANGDEYEVVKVYKKSFRAKPTSGPQVLKKFSRERIDNRVGPRLVSTRNLPDLLRRYDPEAAARFEAYRSELNAYETSKQLLADGNGEVLRSVSGERMRYELLYLKGMADKRDYLVRVVEVKSGEQFGPLSRFYSIEDAEKKLEEIANASRGETGAADRQPKATSGKTKTVSTSKVYDVLLDSIQTDPARFQPRGQAFSVESALNVARDFDPNMMEPVVLWHDEARGIDYILAGHSRFQGFLWRRGGNATYGIEPDAEVRRIPARYFDGDEEAAIRFAHVENDKGTTLTNLERAGYLRTFRGTGEPETAIREEAAKLYKRNASTVYALSFVSPTGKAASTLNQFAGNATGEARDAETMAVWVGKLRSRYDGAGFTDQHEREVYDLLLTNYKTRGRRFTSYNALHEFVRGFIESRMEFGKLADGPLNFGQAVSKSPAERQVDEAVRAAERDLRSAERARDAALREYATRATGDELDRVMKSYHDAVAVAQRDLLQLRQQARSAVASLARTQPGLFAMQARANGRPQAPCLRSNPPDEVGEAAGQIAFLADLDALAVRYRNASRTLGLTDYVLAARPDGGMLALVPAERVAGYPDAPTEGTAGSDAHALYAEFHGYSGTPVAWAVELPTATPRFAGRAETIYYRSPKLIEPGDSGEVHSYFHDFDRGKRPVYAWHYADGGRPAYLIRHTRVDGRGLIN